MALSLPITFGLMLAGGVLADEAIKHAGKIGSSASGASSGSTGLTGQGMNVLKKLSGLASWFGGPNDPSAGGAPASGMGWIPGIAVYDQSTLGGYWRVTAPNGRSTVLPQIDYGPSPSTGRKVDISFNAVPLFGYSEGNFPTSQGNWTLEYLGKTKPTQ